MAVHVSRKTEERKLEPVVGLLGRIVAWKCSRCNWTKLPDTPMDRTPTSRTIEMFSSHDCADHPPVHFHDTPLWQSAPAILAAADAS
jgi:hypothetical protein